jgi:membrane protease YdiL (CAAX protease family)
MEAEFENSSPSVPQPGNFPLRVLLPLVAFLLWNLAYAGALLLLPPPAGIALALVFTAVYLWLAVFPRGPGWAAARRASTLRLRPPLPRTRRWLAAAVPVSLVLSGSLDIVYSGLVRIPMDAYNPFGGLTGTPLGRLSIAVVAIGIAPLVEELVFRGLLQRSLERRWDLRRGIAGAAAVFALVHGIPAAFPLYLFLGVVFGFVVYATRSIWSGVILHAANNSLAFLSLSFAPEELVRPTLHESGFTPEWWTALGVLTLALIAGGWLARGMLRAGRETRDPHGDPCSRGDVAPLPS